MYNEIGRYVSLNNIVSNNILILLLYFDLTTAV